MALHLAMTQFMQLEEHAVDLARIMAVKFGGGLDDHERKRRAVATLQGYIRKHGVDSQGTWGTEKELGVIAIMFQLEILMFTRISKGAHGWTRFGPVFSNPSCMPMCGYKIFLYHTRSRDHYDCLNPSQ